VIVHTRDCSHAPPMALFLPEVMSGAHNEPEKRGCNRPQGGQILFNLAAGRSGQAGNLSDGFGTWADVPHRGAQVAVPVGCQNVARSGDLR
jgi:hypothetical protein